MFADQAKEVVKPFFICTHQIDIIVDTKIPDDLMSATLGKRRITR
ncbi:hypothetical protein CHCC20335_4425 [Bacillus paralicheniformis]|nr:hypothetical protein CHCC20335_4425 [Bacillus paralicheniformis]